MTILLYWFTYVMYKVLEGFIRYGISRSDAKAYLLDYYGLYVASWQRSPRQFLLSLLVWDVSILSALYFLFLFLRQGLALLNLYPSTSEWSEQMLTTFLSTRVTYRSFVPRPLLGNHRGLSNERAKGRFTMEDVQRSSSLGAKIENHIHDFNGSIVRNNGKTLVGYLRRYYHGVLGQINKSDIKVICVFSFYVHHLYTTMGGTGTVFKLKACQVLLMQSIASYRIKDPFLLKMGVKRSGYGLPSCIPRLHRRRIVQGDVRIIRLWISLFSIYRVLKCRSKFDLGTITSPSSFSKEHPEVIAFEEFVNTFWNELIANQGNTGADELIRLTEEVGPKFFPINKSSPSTSPISSKTSSYISSSWPALMLASVALYENSDTKKLILEYCARAGDAHLQFYQRLVQMIDLSRLKVRLEPRFRTSSEKILRPNPVLSGWDWRGHIGKLALKFEAAGKVRVFALVDPWTQWLFHPLHKGVQAILRNIPQDGTFNQTKPLFVLSDWLISRAKLGIYTQISSLDLSAATDRLPVYLQAKLLYPIMGERAKAWAKILTSRGYVLSARNAVGRRGIYYYTVGQPMGALSSWVMLALLHHAIVQFAYFRVCKKKNQSYKWFLRYSVLGDDVVIADAKVSLEYRKFMSTIDVGIGLAKSIVTRSKRRVMEFAKKYIVDGVNCSAVPVRDCITAQISTSVAPEFMTKYNYSINDYLVLRGVGHKARGSVRSDLWSISTRLRVILVLLSYPDTTKDSKTTVTEWLSMRTLVDNWPEDSIPWKLVYDYYLALWRRNYIPRLKRYESLVIKLPTLGQDSIPDYDPFITSNEPVSDSSWSTGRGLWTDLQAIVDVTRRRRRSGGPQEGGFPGPDSNWTFVRSLGFWEYLRSILWGTYYQLQDIPGVGIRPIRYTLKGKSYHNFPLDSKNMMAGPFRMPIQYELIESRSYMMNAALRDAASQAGCSVSQLGPMIGSNLMYSQFVLYMAQLMDTVDEELILPKVTMTTMLRSEEKAYSSFLPKYRRWVEVQRIIYKAMGRPTSRPVKSRAPLALLPLKTFWPSKGSMPLFSSFVYKRSWRGDYFFDSFVNRRFNWYSSNLNAFLEEYFLMILGATLAIFALDSLIDFQKVPFERSWEAGIEDMFKDDEPPTGDGGRTSNLRGSKPPTREGGRIDYQRGSVFAIVSFALVWLVFLLVLDRPDLPPSEIPIPLLLCGGERVADPEGFVRLSTHYTSDTIPFSPLIRLDP